MPDVKWGPLSLNLGVEARVTLKSFAAVERTCHALRNLARQEDEGGQSASPRTAAAGSPPSVPRPIAVRYASFLRREEGVDDALHARRKRSAKQVSQALAAKDAELTSALHPLRRIDACVAVLVLHHEYTSGETTVSRRMVAMDHRISWARFRSWVVGTLANYTSRFTSADAPMTFEYISASGRSVCIDGQRPLDEWIATSWASHPLTLHVIDHHDLVAQCIDRTEQVHQVFDSFDSNRVGSLSFADLLSMFCSSELEELGVTRREVQSFAGEFFEEADANSDVRRRPKPVTRTSGRRDHSPPPQIIRAPRSQVPSPKHPTPPRPTRQPVRARKPPALPPREPLARILAILI